LDSSEAIPSGAGAPARPPRTLAPSAWLASTALAAASLAGLLLVRGGALADALGERSTAFARAGLLASAALGAALAGRATPCARRPLAGSGIALLVACAALLAAPPAIEAARGRAGAGELLVLAAWIAPAGLALGTAGTCAWRVAAPAPASGGGAGGPLVLGAAALGAGLGTWVAGFELVPEVGRAAAANVALALGATLGVAALALARGRADASWAAEDERGERGRARQLLGSALAGAAALAIERYFAGELDVIAGPTQRTAWAATAVAAGCFGLGAWLAALVAPRRAVRTAALGIALVGLGVAAALASRAALAEDAEPAFAALLQLGGPALGLGVLAGALVSGPPGSRARALAAALAGAGVRALALEPLLPRRPDAASSWREELAPSAALSLAHFPRLVQPHARKVLVDGCAGELVARAHLDLGAEVTLSRVPCSHAAAARDPREIARGGRAGFSAVGDDLRRHLERASARYDLILVDATAPWLRGATAQISEEFFRAAGARLASGGIVAVALPISALGPGDLALVLRTALSVFPDAALFDTQPDVKLLALAPRGVLPGAADVDAAQALLDATPRAAEAVTAAFGSADVRTPLIGRLWLAGDALRAVPRAIPDERTIHDDDLALELGSFGTAQAVAGLGAELASTNEAFLFAATDPDLWKRLCIEWRATGAQLDALRGHKTRYFRGQDFERGLELVELGLVYEPDDPELEADLLLFSDLAPEVFEAGRQRLLERSPRESYRLGRSLFQLGRLEQASAVLEPLARRLERSVTALTAVAEVREALGQPEAAAEARERARGLDPLADDLLPRNPDE
jgi:tetratricopeptide (TPR) repeat protein